MKLAPIPVVLPAGSPRSLCSIKPTGGSPIDLGILALGIGKLGSLGSTGSPLGKAGFVDP